MTAPFIDSLRTRCSSDASNTFSTAPRRFGQEPSTRRRASSVTQRWLRAFTGTSWLEPSCVQGPSWGPSWGPCMGPMRSRLVIALLCFSLESEPGGKSLASTGHQSSTFHRMIHGDPRKQGPAVTTSQSKQHGNNRPTITYKNRRLH